MPERSQTHQFSCAGCGTANAVQVPTKCGCHECTEREWRNSVHRTHQTWAKVCFGVVLTAALMVLGMYVSSDIRSHADKVALQNKHDQQIITLKKLEIERLKEMAHLHLDAYEVRTGLDKQGRLVINLVAKDNVGPKANGEGK